MPRGGRRVGAGGKKGLPEKRHRLADARPQTRGILRKHNPLDVMVMTMNGFISAAEILGKDIVKVNDRIVTQLGLLERASSIAKDCAPYMHPRLSNIEHSGTDGGAIQHAVTVRFVGAKP